MLWITLLYGAVLFWIQQLLFKKCSRLIFQLIPPLWIGLIYLISLGLILSELNLSGGVRMNTLYSLILAGVNTVGLIFDGFAWLIEKV